MLRPLRLDGRRRGGRRGRYCRLALLHWRSQLLGSCGGPWVTAWHGAIGWRARQRARRAIALCRQRTLYPAGLGFHCSSLNNMQLEVGIQCEQQLRSALTLLAMRTAYVYGRSGLAL